MMASLIASYAGTTSKLNRAPRALIIARTALDAQVALALGLAVLDG